MIMGEIIIYPKAGSAEPISIAVSAIDPHPLSLSQRERGNKLYNPTYIINIKLSLKSKVLKRKI
jgi:hypothetical protein